MKRGIALAVAGTAILAGCSSNTSTTGEPAETSVLAPTSAGAPEAKVHIGGEDQNVSGTATCATAAGQVNIAIGGPTAGVVVVLTDADPPGVTSVALGNVNGVTLGYTRGTGEGDAKATKDGNSYKITGTATGVDMSHPPLDVLEKPFEIDVTCP